MTRALLAVIVVLIAALTIDEIKNGRARAAVVRSALAADSAAAERDTTREVRVRGLEDSVRVFARRAQQQEQRADGLDRALDAERVAKISTAVHVAALDTVVRTDSVFTATGLPGRAKFLVREAPFLVAGEVFLPSGNPALGADSVSLHVEMDSIPVQIRVSCKPFAGTDVRQALVMAEGPRWARVVIGEAQQDVSVCNPQFAERGAASRLSRLLGRAGVSVGVGFVLDRAGQVIARPGLSIGMRVWP